MLILQLVLERLSGSLSCAQISLYDLRNKLIAYQSPQARAVPCLTPLRCVSLPTAIYPPLLTIRQRCPFPPFPPTQGDVSHVMCVPGCVTVLQTDGTAFALVEKDLPAKLELLFRKSLYGIAISLIQAEGGTEAAVAEVRRRLADHLYAKQDYDGAMAQYVLTIGCGFLRDSVKKSCSPMFL